MTVAAGHASSSVSGNTLTITNTPNSILNWNSFSIGAQNTVRFEQLNAQSQVLNRVTGNDPSAILGQLSSNGRVWLLNHNGVLFGPGARIDVAGLVVSTLNLNDQDWLARKYRFSATPGLAGTLVNQGALRSSLGGHIVLLGRTVTNQGKIEAPGGQIVLAAGEQIELIDTGAPHLSVRIGAGAGSVLNLGELTAAGGRIDIHAASVNQQGIVSVDTVEQGPGGEILLRASQNLQLGASSQTSADGASGGQVTLDGGAGSTNVQGSVSARGSSGLGGQVSVLGRDISVQDGALIDVSGSSGGGVALLGGGAQGRDASVPNARSLLVSAQARVRADATGSGNGGRIILWSDQATRAYGNLSARGGPLGGNGGWIETSGGWLDARPSGLDVSAPAGQSGSWLLDPYNILITDQGPDAPFNTDSNFTATGNDAVIWSATLSAALNQGTNVIVSTSANPSAGTQPGDITLDSAHINVAASVPGSLTLIADRDITFTNSSISGFFVTGNQTGPMPVTLIAGRAGQGSVAMSSSSIGTQGGNITIQAPEQINLNNSSLSTSGLIRLLANAITLQGDTGISSTAQGDAIILAGPNAAGPMASFTNLASSTVLNVSPKLGGRWIVYNKDAAPANFTSGGMTSDFTRYGAAYGAWSADTGNGFVFAAQPAAVMAAATVTATAVQRSVSGNVTPPNISLNGPATGINSSGMLDITPSLVAGNTASANTSATSTASASTYAPISIADMSQDALQAVLASRDRQKQALFADSIHQLEKNPALADLRPCRNPKETEEGLCLITPMLQESMKATLNTSVATSPSLPTPRPAATPNQTPPPAPAKPALASVAPQPSLALLVPDLRQHRIKTAALPQIRRKLAVVIGVDRYADPSMPPLANAVRDARAMANLFENTLGYETLLLENASKSAVVSALNRLTLLLGPNDSAVIYYAGHGYLLESTHLGYWQLADSDAKVPETWLSNTDIGRLIARMSASQIALISDSCYSGSLVSDERIRAKPTTLDPAPLLASKAVVVMSSGGNEPVADEGKQGHSPFAWNLMGALKQVASWQPGGNVFERVRFAVARELPQRPQYGASSVAGHQPGSDYLFEQRQFELGK
jgi:filamentous hemagglutinin family protein